MRASKNGGGIIEESSSATSQGGWEDRIGLFLAGFSRGRIGVISQFSDDFGPTKKDEMVFRCRSGF